MAKSPTNWGEFLDTFETWWHECTSFLDPIAEDDDGELDESFGDWIRYIVEWCYDRTNVDPAPLWELHRLVSSHTEPEAIDTQIERCSMIADYLFHKCLREGASDGSITDQRARRGRPPGSKGKTRTTIEEKILGHELDDAIALQCDVEPEYVAKIRRQMAQVSDRNSPA
jgi:hypothetical protein